MKMLGIEFLLTTKISDCIIVILHCIYQNVQLQEVETVAGRYKNVKFNNEKTTNMIIIELKKSDEN